MKGRPRTGSGPEHERRQDKPGSAPSLAISSFLPLGRTQHEWKSAYGVATLRNSGRSVTVRSAQLKQRGIASFSPKTVERSFFRKPGLAQAIDPPEYRPILRDRCLAKRDQGFTGCSLSERIFGQSGSRTMAIKEKRSHVERRSGKDRRSGVGTRTEKEKRLVGERRSGKDRRSGRERRLDTKEEIIRRLERAEFAIRELQHFIATHRV
jgi:hypothetical protein